MPFTDTMRPDMYGSDHVVSTTDAAGTIGRIAFDFGFRANKVHLFNDKATDVYLSFQSTAGDTGGFRVRACSNLTFDFLVGGLSVASTTTSTGDKVRVLATRG